MAQRTQQQDETTTYNNITAIKKIPRKNRLFNNGNIFKAKLYQRDTFCKMRQSEIMNQVKEKK